MSCKENKMCLIFPYSLSLINLIEGENLNHQSKLVNAKVIKIN